MVGGSFKCLPLTHRGRSFVGLLRVLSHTWTCFEETAGDLPHVTSWNLRTPGSELGTSVSKDVSR